LKLGVAAGGVSTQGTGDAADWGAVTRGEIATLLNSDIGGTTSTGAGANLVITSSTTGKNSRLLAGAGTLNTLIGIPNTTVDYGAQGLGLTAMSDANYAAFATLNGVTDPTNHGVSINNRAAAGFDMVSDGATDADYVDLLIMGT